MIIIDDKEIGNKESELSKFLEETTKELEKTDIELNLSEEIDKVDSEVKVNRDKELEVSINKINYIDSVTKLDKIKEPIHKMKCRYALLLTVSVIIMLGSLFIRLSNNMGLLIYSTSLIIMVLLNIRLALRYKTFRSLDNIIEYSENNLHAELYNIGNITGICPLNLKEYRLLENFLDLKDKCFMLNAFYHSKSKLDYIYINLETNKIKAYGKGNANSINFIRDIKIDKLDIASVDNSSFEIKVSCRKIKLTLPKEWFSEHRIDELSKIKININ